MTLWDQGSATILGSWITVPGWGSGITCKETKDINGSIQFLIRYSIYRNIYRNLGSRRTKICALKKWDHQAKKMPYHDPGIQLNTPSHGLNIVGCFIEISRKWEHRKLINRKYRNFTHDAIQS